MTLPLESVIKYLKFLFNGLKFLQILYLAFSAAFLYTLKPTCLLDMLRNTWSEDVGLSDEGHGPAIRFLTNFVYITDDMIFTAPYNPNLCYIFNQAEHQHTARLGRYEGASVHQFKHFHSFFLDLQHLFAPGFEFLGQWPCYASAPPSCPQDNPSFHPLV